MFSLFTRRAVSLVATLVVGTATLGIGGCVNQNNYDALRASNDALKARNQELADQVKALEEARAQLLQRYKDGDLTLEQARALIAQLEAQMRDRDARLADMNKKLEGMSVGPLDEATDAALQEFAGKYPELLSYDPTKGMIRFNSDLTFSSGSYDLTPNAKSSIDALAKILKELPSAQQYDIKVVGHTDTQRVSARAGRNFSNNIELSAFRAITVRSELVGQGMLANKVEFAGWGEFRPAVPNSPTGNTPANRRVEVYLVRSAWNQPLPTSPTVVPKTASPATAKPATAGAATTPPAATTGKPGAANPDIMK